MIDCLERVAIEPGDLKPRADRCIATLASGGYSALLDDMLGSLAANGGCGDSLRLVLSVDDDESCRFVAEAHGAVVIPCRSRIRPNPTVKAALYSIALLVDAHRFLCLDADMLVLGSLAPVFDALEAADPIAVLACPEGDGRLTLGEAVERIYGGASADIERLAGSSALAGYPLVVNDGLFAGSREGLLGLDREIRDLPGAVEWVDRRADIWWRNQFVFNLALARRGCGVLLDRQFNIQLHVEDVQLEQRSDGVHALCADGAEARVLHFGGTGRHKHPEVRGRFAAWRPASG